MSSLHVIPLLQFLNLIFHWDGGIYYGIKSVGTGNLAQFYGVFNMTTTFTAGFGRLYNTTQVTLWRKNVHVEAHSLLGTR